MPTRQGPRRSLAALLGLAFAVSVPAFAGVATAAVDNEHGAAAKRMVFYSVADQEQFVNNEDDRARGQGNNPFGNFNDVSPVVKEKGNGPFAGDQALYGFTLYKDVNLRQKAGSAVFTCQYDFKKQAFCNARYRLDGGVLYASGEVGFDSKRVKLNVTTGLGTFASARGALAIIPSAKNAQQVTVSLT